VGAYATVGKANARVFHAIALQMLKVIITANSLELAKTAWAFGTANVHHDRLFSQIAKLALSRLHQFQPQELSNLLWGFAANDFFHQELFTKASEQAQHMNLNSQQLANILWAITRAKQQLPNTSITFRMLLPKCCQQIHTFKPQEYASTAMAIAKAYAQVGEELVRLDTPPPAEVLYFLIYTLPIMLPRLQAFSDQSLANILTAFTALQAVGLPMLVTEIGQLVVERIHRLETPVLLQFIRTFSSCNLVHSQVRALVEGKLHQNDTRAVALGVSQGLYGEMISRLDRLNSEEKRSLTRLCSRALKIQQDPGEASVADLRRYCLALSKNGEECMEATFRVGAGALPAEAQELSLSQALSLGRDFQEVAEISPAHHAAGSTEVNGAEVSSSNAASASEVDTSHNVPHYEFTIKNGFLDEWVPNDNWDPRACSKPPLDFLRAGHPHDPMEVQRLRESYQQLKAVKHLDFFPHDDVYDEAAPSSGAKESASCTSSPSHIASSEQPHISPASEKGQTQTSTKVWHMTPDLLEAFRKDYQDGGAIPGLDWRIEQSPWLAEGESHLYPTSTCMKQSFKKKAEVDLGPPLDFLKTSEEAQAIRSAYQTDLRAIPGLDFPGRRRVSSNKMDTDMSDTFASFGLYSSVQKVVKPSQWAPKFVKPSQWLLDADEHFSTRALRPLEESGLFGPPLELFSRTKKNATHWI
jgi:hypothetical protein